MNRRRALTTGLLATGLYIALAVVSGHLSPLARRPLLDGLAPPTAYRWVDPPPELGGTNEPPSPGTFGARLGGAGSETSTFTTDDAQVTLILPKGTFAKAAGQRSVQVTVEPVVPSSVGAPDPPLRIVGNVISIQATYQPSGEPAPVETEPTVVLVYPLLPNDHGGHAIVASEGGHSWTALDTHDLTSVQQADAALGSLGYVAVAGSAPSPTAVPTQRSSGRAATVIVVALVVLALGAAIALRRGSRKPSARPGSSSRR